MNQNKDENIWQQYLLITDRDVNGFYTTKDGGRLAPDICLDDISKDCIIKGNSLIEGKHTSIAAGAIVEDSYCKNAVIEEKAVIRDSVLITTGKYKAHKCDSAGQFMAKGGKVKVGKDSNIQSSHLINSSAGKTACISSCTLNNSDIGDDNQISLARMDLVHSERCVSIIGPTEVSEAWLARKTHINKRGYFEGVFSGEFPILRFDEKTGELSIKEIIDIPNVSLYGTNTINSTNSGRLLSQPDGIMNSFGPQVGLWYDRLLSHEQLRLGPCCWVSPWTKLIGESAKLYTDLLAAVSDRLHTYLLAFSVAGYKGQSILGEAFFGESIDGPGHKQRKGAWVFTHCPDAVIKMVQRLYDALEDDEKNKADVVVIDSLKNALCLLKFWAFELGTDLNKPRQKQRGSRGKWLWDYKNLLKEHLNSGIWTFENGKPVGWIFSDGKWQNEKLNEIRKTELSKDGDLDLTEDDLLTEPQGLEVHLENGLNVDKLYETFKTGGNVEPSAQIHSSAIIDATARISMNVKVNANAYIGPGTILEGNTEIAANAWLFRAVVRDANVGKNTRLHRCVIEGTPDRATSVGNDVELVGCHVFCSSLGHQSTGIDSRVHYCSLADDTTLSMFASVTNVTTTKPTIIGGEMTDCEINTTLMSMHSAGKVKGLIAEPVRIEIDGETVEIPAVPMLGGGCQIHGKMTKPGAVVMEGVFIGSNAIIEEGCFIGLGAFVLGKLGPNEGLLPFSLSTQQGSETDEIGVVLSRFPDIAITHYINWTYQSLPKESACDVIHLIKGGIEQGIRAIRSELDRRQKSLPWLEDMWYSRYKSLSSYKDEQLEDGLKTYEEALDNGCWDMVFDGQNLSFENKKGLWAEKKGHVRWQKA